MSQKIGLSKPASNDRERTPKSARERKAAFDERMKNQGRRIDPEEPERFACVLYLSRPARDVLQEHRKMAGLVTDGPRKDSHLVEKLLLGMSGDATLADAALADARKPPDELLATNQVLRKRVLSLDRKLDKAEVRVSELEFELPEEIRYRHRMAFSHRYSELHAELVETLSTADSSPSNRHRAHRLLLDYMLDILT